MTANETATAGDQQSLFTAVHVLASGCATRYSTGSESGPLGSHRPQRTECFSLLGCSRKPLKLHYAIVPDRKPIGMMVSITLNDKGAFTDKAIFKTVYVFNDRILQHHGMLHNGGPNLTTVPDRGERTNKGPFYMNILADNHRPSHRTVDNVDAFAQVHSTIHLARRIHLTLDLATGPPIQYGGV